MTTVKLVIGVEAIVTHSEESNMTKTVTLERLIIVLAMFCTERSLEVSMMAHCLSYL